MTDSSAPKIPDSDPRQSSRQEPSSAAAGENLQIRNLEELTVFFESVRARLEKIVRFRLDPAFQARIDPADVLQEAFLQIAKRHRELVESPDVHPLVWIRQRVLQTLWDIKRNHGRDKRSVHREREIAFGGSDTTSITMARWLADDVTSPSQRVMKDEEQQRLQTALESMNQIDREILAMRHFEHLSNLETAQALGLSPTAASNRYVRAAIRLAEIMQAPPRRELPRKESPRKESE